MLGACTHISGPDLIWNITRRDLEAAAIFSTTMVSELVIATDIEFAAWTGSLASF
jgi:hypothetical protein